MAIAVDVAAASSGLNSRVASIMKGGMDDARTRTLSQGHVMAILTPHGDIDGEEHHGSGLYLLDSRLLSRVRVLLEETRLSDPQGQWDADRAAFLSFAHWSGEPERVDLVFKRHLRLREPRTLTLEIEILNGASKPFRDRLRIEIAGDAADIFEIRDEVTGVLQIFLQREAPLPKRRLETCVLTDGLAFDYRGVDGIRRGAYVELEPHPDSPPENGVFEYALDVPPGQRADFRIICRLMAELEIERDGGRDSPIGFFLAEPKRRVEVTVSRPPDWRLQRLLDRSVRDLGSLLIPTVKGSVPAAGVPWYYTLFGRDALITALEVLPEAPQLAQHVLRALAHFQGEREDERTCEEAGKVLHELRVGELTNAGYLPFAPHYGTVDATPLFVWLAGRLYRQTEDGALIQEVRGALEGALTWIERRLARDRYIVYQKGRFPGPTNMGWKDSETALVAEDGRAITGEPIALSEVQAYAYGALREGAYLMKTLGNDERARSLDAQAEALRARFIREFWMEDERFFALALRAEGCQVQTVTSNPAHGLLTGILPEDQAEAVVKRLLRDDLFSGYGIRTLSSRHRGYSPVSYHRGSVWPHDNALILLGMLEYGFGDEARAVAGALMDAAEVFDWRLPELFCGFDKSAAERPVVYPDACEPQAWSAGAGFVVVRTLRDQPLIDPARIPRMK